jgi:hypothetical protein
MSGHVRGSTITSRYEPEALQLYLQAPGPPLFETRNLAPVLTVDARFRCVVARAAVAVHEDAALRQSQVGNVAVCIPIRNDREIWMRGA